MSHLNAVPDPVPTVSTFRQPRIGDIPWSYTPGGNAAPLDHVRDLEEQLVRMAHLNDQMVERCRRLEAQRHALLSLAAEAEWRAPFWFVVAGNATRVGQLRTDTVRKVLEG